MSGKGLTLIRDGESAVSTVKTVAQVSTTVDRAGDLLQLLAESPQGLGITELTRRLNTQRAPLYRILQALIDHRLVRRDPHKRYLLGVGTLQLARAYEAQFPVGIEPALRRVADDTGLTASLVSADGDVLTTVVSITPSTVAEHVFTPPGFRHPDGPLATRMAVLASKPPQPGELEEVTAARSRGFAIGRRAAIPVPYAVAAVIPTAEQTDSRLALTLLSLASFEVDDVAEPLLRTAYAIGATIDRSGLAL